MKHKYQKRSSYLSANGIELGKKPIYVWGYDKSEDFVCRLEINAAGIAVFTGKKGQKKLRDLTWEELITDLKKARR